MIIGGGRAVRWCWVNFQCRGVLLIWIRVRQGPSALAVGAGGGCLDIFSLVYHFSFLSPSLWETARYRLKYCLKGPLSQNQQTNQPIMITISTAAETSNSTKNSMSDGIFTCTISCNDTKKHKRNSKKSFSPFVTSFYLSRQFLCLKENKT